MTVRRGEIYWVEFGPVKGSEQGGLRPALVVQNDIGNRHSSTTVMVAITRTIILIDGCAVKAFVQGLEVQLEKIVVQQGWPTDIQLTESGIIFLDGFDMRSC